ncbi:hypothetical protein EJ04DRAFT_510077 [Polyplosphaeria fusca]|uniref:N-acetyltransferase domain-containing protein n=1 Tax=Polyplosphaeria fusca TaxID=682080 RepID=A0A9P4R6J7_9PLEO|nr:hypothetical protein EJ04DRAFT_510077 [Polyplosphaeria fusca]
MPLPHHSILPVTIDDVPTLGGFLASSKLQLAINRFLFKDWPNEAAQLANYTQAVGHGLSDPNVTSLKVVCHDSQEIVAHLGLSLRQGTAKGAPGDEMPVPDAMVPDVFYAVTDAIQSLNQGIANKDHMELTWIFVKPSARNQGIGTELVQAAIKKAQEAALPLLFNSEPPVHGFFLKLGFAETKTVDIDLSKWAPPYCGWGLFRLSAMALR